MGSMGEGELESLEDLCKEATEKLGPWGLETLRSLIEDFNSNRIEHTEFRNSIQLLFDTDIIPSYKLIPEEEQRPAKHEALNNKCSLVKFEAFEHKKLTDYEEAMARCEEEMIEADRLMECLRSVVEKAEKVIKGEMKVKDLGVMFNHRIKELCPADVFERVRQDYKNALPEILPRLKRKLNNATVGRAKKKSRLKQVMEDNTAKQRDSTAQGQKKK